MTLLTALSTRNRLIETAIRVLSDNPTATMADISQAAGVQRMTLNRKLGTRENMMQIIAKKAIKDMDIACSKAASKEKTAIGQLKAIVKTLVPMADRVHFFWQFPDDNSLSMFEAELKSHDEELSQLISEAKTEGSIKTTIPNEWILASIDAMIVSAHSVTKADKLTKDEAAFFAVETLFSGIETSA